MSTIQAKIEEIEAEMARTQKNKATEFHIGTLKAKLAKLRAELINPKGSGGNRTCLRHSTTLCSDCLNSG